MTKFAANYTAFAEKYKGCAIAWSALFLFMLEKAYEYVVKISKTNDLFTLAHFTLCFSRLFYW